MWLKAAGVEDVPAGPGLTFNSMSLALDAAIAGQGVVLAYSNIAAADLAAGRLVRLFSLALPDQFAYYIVTAPGALERPEGAGLSRLAAPERPIAPGLRQRPKAVPILPGDALLAIAGAVGGV